MVHRVRQSRPARYRANVAAGPFDEGWAYVPRRFPGPRTGPLGPGVHAL